MPKKLCFHVLSGLALALSAAMLAGCSANFVPSPVTPERVPIGNIQGAVHGGQAPVSGAQVYLYQAGTTGYGSAATSLICNKNLMSASQFATCTAQSNVYEDSSSNYYVKTDSGGNFALSGDYTCTEGTQVYMVAVGGNPGLTPGSFVTGATYAPGSTTITVLSSSGVVPGMTVSGSGIAANSTVTAVNGAAVTLNQSTAGGSVAVNFGAPGTTATFSAVSPTITVASTTGVAVGDVIAGSGVGGTVTAVNTATNTLTLSQNTTAASSVPVTFSAASTTANFSANNPTITVASAAGIIIGQTVTGPGIAANSTVTLIIGKTLTLSQNTTAAGNTVAVTFSVPTTATFSAATKAITVANAAGIASGQTVSGTGIAAGSTVKTVVGTTINLSQNTTAASSEAVTFSVPSTTATFSANLNTITVASATGIAVGDTIAGSGVGGTVTAISGKTLTLSQNTTAVSFGMVTFSVPPTTATFSSGSNTVTVASATGIAVGDTIYGTGVGGTVTAVNGKTLTLSQNNTAPGSGAAVTFGAPVNNTAIVQMAGLGQCPAAGNLAAQVPYLTINEVTTVAFAYAMGGFGSNAFNISSNAANSTASATGIANAMLNAGNIVNVQWGQAPTTANGNANSINPQAKIYSLADILATCVNTSNAVSTSCASLFNYATNAQGTQPTDEATAIFNIVHSPTQNVANIWNLSSSTPVFAPTLSGQPTDWTMPVVYQGVVGTPVNIAFDASGDAWIGDQAKGVVKIGPQGAVSTITGNWLLFTFIPLPFGTISGVAVAPNGAIWAVDSTWNVVDILNSAGTVTTTIEFSGNLSGPAAIAFDKSGNAFVVNETAGTVSIFNSSGALATQDTCQNGSCNVGGLNKPNWIAVDTTGNAWVPSQTNNIGELPYKGGNYSNSNTNYSSIPTSGLAFDGSGNLWAAGYQVNELEKLSAAGTVTNTMTNGGLSSPQTVTVDGAGNIWVGNGSAAVISGFSNTASALYPAGLTTGSTGYPLAVTPDSSGNLWSANSDGTVSQLLGAATPVATPILPGSFGVRP